MPISQAHDFTLGTVQMVRRHQTKILQTPLLIAAALGVLGIVTVSDAQVCPGDIQVAFNQLARAGASDATSSAAANLIRNNLPCSAVPTAPASMPSLQPSSCNTFTNSTIVLFDAIWANTAARTVAGTQAGCRFDCGAFTCRVRAADGMPVELLELSIE